jgi:hypothetical protein
MNNDADIQELLKLARERVESLGSFSGRMDVLNELRYMDEQAAYLRERLLSIIKDDIKDNIFCAKNMKKQHDLLLRFLIIRDIVFGSAN